MRIAIAGGTGLVGRHVADAARNRGHEVVALSRSAGVDLTSADDLAARLAHVDAVIDTTNVGTQRRKAAERFFGDVTRHLLAAGSAAGVGHHVALSIIGADRVPMGYYAGKCVQERLVEAGPVPWSVLRSAQFHEFAEQVLGFLRVGPVSLVPGMLTQPVAAVEVGAALVDLAERGPAGWAPEIAGPEIHQLVDLARRVDRHRGLGRRIVPLRVPGAAGRAVRGGALTPAADGLRGRMTFDEWLG